MKGFARKFECCWFWSIALQAYNGFYTHLCRRSYRWFFTEYPSTDLRIDQKLLVKDLDGFSKGWALSYLKSGSRKLCEPGSRKYITSFFFCERLRQKGSAIRRVKVSRKINYMFLRKIGWQKGFAKGGRRPAMSWEVLSGVSYNQRRQLRPKPWNCTWKSTCRRALHRVTHASCRRDFCESDRQTGFKHVQRRASIKFPVGYTTDIAKARSKIKTMFSQQTGKGWDYVPASCGPFIPVTFLQSFPFAKRITYTLIGQTFAPRRTQVFF